MATNLQTLAQGVRAQFPQTPAPTNNILPKQQAVMPGSGNANTNAQNTQNILFGKTPTTSSFGTGSPNTNAANTQSKLFGTATPAKPTTTQNMPSVGQQPVTITEGMKGLSFGNAPAGFNPITTGGDISKAQTTGQYGGSVVDYLNSQGQKSDYGSRAALAGQYGIQNYSGTADQNVRLLQALQSAKTSQNTQTAPSTTQTQQQASQTTMVPTGGIKVAYTPPQTATQVPQTQPQGNIGQTGTTTIGTQTTGVPGQDLSYGGLIQQLLNKGEDVAGRRRALDVELSNQMRGELDSPTSIEFKTGHMRNIENAYAQQKAALEGELGNIANVYGRAVTAVAPTMQFGQLTDPRTGLPISSDTYGGNPQLQSAVQQAVQLVRNGTDPNSAAVQNLLGTFGMPGQAAFTNAMQQVSQGTYNPTAQSAISQANVQTGIGATQTAAQLGVSMDRYHNIANQAVNFLTTAGINNYLSPAFNEPINKFLQGNLSPADKIVADAMFADLKNAGASIIGASSSLTPTEITDMTASFDPRNLSPRDLQVYIDNISKLGQTNKAAFEKQSAGALGAGTTPYMGTPAIGGQTLQTGSTVDTPTAAAASVIGLGMKALTGFTNMFSNIFK